MQPFSLLLGVGGITGLMLAGWRAPQKERVRYIDAGVLTLLGALLGSRMAFVLVNWAYYQSHLVEIPQVWLGGLSGIGGLMGGVLAMLILAAWWNINLGGLADVLLPLGGSLAITAWMGCWVDRCGYGMLSSAWWALPAHDEWGVLSNRLPVQLIGAIISLILVWLLDRNSGHFPVRGMSAAIGIFGLSAVVFGLSYLRADPIRVWNGFRLEAWGALGLMIIATITVVVLLVVGKSRR